MPSPFDYMQNRWLTWHERWPMPEIESLKRQIETVRAEIAKREDEPLLSETSSAFLGLPYDENQAEAKAQAIADMQEVLATLERLMPPF